MSRFVTLEGIDGTGKSSVCQMVVSALEKEGVKLKATREPSRSWLGDLVKGSYEKDISAFSEALLFCADRADHTRRIREWLGEGFNVVSDRYVDSTVAYQGAILRPHFPGEDLLGWLRMVNEPYIIRPDLTVLFIADPEICLERTAARGDRSKFERLETLKAVQHNYLEIKKGSDRFVVVDAERSLEKVALEAQDHIRKVLEKDLA